MPVPQELRHESPQETDDVLYPLIFEYASLYRRSEPERTKADEISMKHLLNVVCFSPQEFSIPEAITKTLIGVFEETGKKEYMKDYITINQKNHRDCAETDLIRNALWYAIDKDIIELREDRTIAPVDAIYDSLKQEIKNRQHVLFDIERNCL